MKGREYILGDVVKKNGVVILCVLLLDTHELFNAITFAPIALKELKHTDLDPRQNHPAVIHGKSRFMKLKSAVYN